jgi:hypothetical protein
MARRSTLIALACSALLGSVFLESGAFGQTYPTDPSQYPAGQYPPGQYPDQYPARLQGGIPLGIPMPQIKLPGRKAKDKDSERSDGSKITLASAEGALRKLGEKDLLLETGKERVLKFRLLAKTQLLDTKGEPVRDSLLHPGDRLTVQASPDDPETAVKVILVHAGTSAERDAASVPVSEAKIVTPTEEDLKKPQSEEAHPDLHRIPAETETAVADASGSTDELILDAREAAASYNSELPNFLVLQTTTRFRSWMGPHNWQALDVVTADVAVVDGKEDYRNILVNGHAPQGPLDKSGSWSTGEFSTTLEDILSPRTAAAFVAHGSETIAGRDAWVYNLTVQHPNSHWVIVSAGGNKYNPAYTGTIWVDKETRRVLRIEQHAGDLPRDFSYNKAETALEYGFVRIEGKQYLLPVTSENSACFTGTSECVRNEITFRNYRKFTANSDIKYDKFASQ